MMVLRLEQELAELAGEDRAFCLGLVRELLESVGA
jgi:hypothetical protein